MRNSTTPPRAGVIERASSPPEFLDARKASDRCHVPFDWLRDRRQRMQHGIPFYRFGHLVRYRVSELEQWQRRHAERITPGATA